MIDIRLEEGQDGYDVIGEYIQRYWDAHKGYGLYNDDVVFSISLSHDGKDWCPPLNEVAGCYRDYTGIEHIDFSNDWHEGEKYIRLYGIKAINLLGIIEGGIF